MSIAINIGDVLNIHGRDHWDNDRTYRASITKVTTHIVYFSINGLFGWVGRDAVASDEFGTLSATDAATRAMPSVGDVVDGDRSVDYLVHDVAGDAVVIEPVAAKHHLPNDDERIGKKLDFMLSDFRFNRTFDRIEV